MNRLSEPHDVDFTIGDSECEPLDANETLRVIEEYKSRPEYLEELQEAKRILSAIRIDSRSYGVPDAKALLDHWRMCGADLDRDRRGAEIAVTENVKCPSAE